MQGMLTQQWLSTSGKIFAIQPNFNHTNFLKAAVGLFTTIMLLAPFGLAIISESAMPVGLLGIYPLTIFACLRWLNKTNDQIDNVANKTASVVAVYSIYKLAEYIDIHSTYSIPLIAILAVPALFISLILILKT